MRRLTVIRVLMAIALVVVLTLFIGVEGSGRRFTMIECLSFSADGSRIAISKLNGHDAQTPGKGYMADVSRTLSLIAASTGMTEAVIHQDVKHGNCGPAFSYWRLGRTSAIINPRNDCVMTHAFGGGGLTQYCRGGEEEKIGEIEPPALNIALSKSGNLVAASGQFSLTIFETTTHKQVMDKELEELHGSPFLSASFLAFSDDEARIAVANLKGVHVWDIASGTRLSDIIEGHQPWVEAIAMAANDTLLVCSTEGVQRFDFSGHVVATLTDSKNCRACCVSNDGQHLAFIADGNVLIFDLFTAKRTNTVRMESASALAFSPDAKSIAVGDSDGNVSLIDVSTGKGRWISSPPGRYRRSWTLPTCLLAVWGFIAWRLLKPSE